MVSGQPQCDRSSTNSTPAISPGPPDRSNSRRRGKHYIEVEQRQYILDKHADLIELHYIGTTAPISSITSHKVSGTTVIETLSFLIPFFSFFSSELEYSVIQMSSSAPTMIPSKLGIETPIQYSRYTRYIPAYLSRRLNMFRLNGEEHLHHLHHLFRKTQT